MFYNIFWTFTKRFGRRPAKPRHGGLHHTLVVPQLFRQTTGLTFDWHNMEKKMIVVLVFDVKVIIFWLMLISLIFFFEDGLSVVLYQHLRFVNVSALLGFLDFGLLRQQAEIPTLVEFEASRRGHTSAGRKWPPQPQAEPELSNSCFFHLEPNKMKQTSI